MHDSFPQERSSKKRQEGMPFEDYKLPSGDTLRRVEFPDSTQQYMFMYVFSPNPADESYKVEEELGNEGDGYQDFWNKARSSKNSVLVFETEEERRAWFERTRDTFEPEEQNRISKFLHL